MSFPTLRLAFAVATIAAACSPNKPPTPPDAGGPMCTTEAKICPDGSGVGRTGPNCEFAPCPAAASDAAPDAAPVACTREAKVCPDGSAVGRTGPNCEFAECPAAPAPAP